MSVFSENLKKAREGMNLTQKDISDKLHITQSAWALYEQGRREPKIDMLIRIADILNMSIDQLFGRTNISKDNDELSTAKAYCTDNGCTVQFMDETKRAIITFPTSDGKRILDVDSDVFPHIIHDLKTAADANIARYRAILLSRDLSLLANFKQRLREAIISSKANEEHERTRAFLKWLFSKREE